jgi:3-hydroxyisobutyrate dehydrogenase-like beta-hydroxyacid dehydrogenase
MANNVLNIGFLGFGEVGYTFASGLKSREDCQVFAYDNNQDADWRGELIRKRAAESGTQLVANGSELVAKTDIVFAMVPAKFALSAAEGVLPSLKPGKVYCDLGSAAPATKKEIGILVHKTGALFLDGSIMGSMPLYGFKAPILLSGKDAGSWAERLRTVGFTIRSAGDEVGMASSAKMLRSVFTKGYEALVVETFHAASLLGLEDIVQDFLANTFDQETFAESVSRYLTSNAIHAARRVGEVEGVEQVLTEIGVEPIMTSATKKRLAWSAAFNLSEKFGGELPEDPKAVLDAFKEAVAQRKE